MNELIREVEEDFILWDRSRRMRREIFDIKKKVRISECVVLMSKVVPTKQIKRRNQRLIPMLLLKGICSLG